MKLISLFSFPRLCNQSSLRQIYFKLMAQGNKQNQRGGGEEHDNGRERGNRGTERHVANVALPVIANCWKLILNWLRAALQAEIEQLD